MKNLNLILGVLLFIVSLTNIHAQTLNWHALDSTKHIINGSLGLDHSVSYGVGYGYKLNTKLPIVLSTNFSMPSGENIFDDFKTKIGGQICLFNKSNFVGSFSIFGIYRRYETKLVRLQNFGTDMKVAFGYYKPKWFASAEMGLDKAIVTHFKHSQEFKDHVYAYVVDGWYEPSTGGNFYYGVSTGYSLSKADITLTLGRVLSQDFKTTPFLPFYLNVGFNYKIK